MNLDFNEGNLYICKEEQKLNFCKEIFSETEYKQHKITSLAIFKLIIAYFASFKTEIDLKKEVISVDDWLGFFNGTEGLREFQKLLIGWDYFNTDNEVT